jgi:histidine phosphotransferase ChpT
MEVDSRGPRARLKAEVATGLRGETLSEGLAGQWIQAYWLHQVVAEAGGKLSVDLAEEHVRLRIEIPA